MSGIAGFFAMGGYAEFVWPAYGVALVVLAGLTAHSWRRYRQSVLAVERLQRTRPSR
jgi:heme exporter protein D